MIIFGTRNTQLSKADLFEKCANCESRNSMEMYVFQTYAHVFWIPAIPLHKTGISMCSQCKQVLKFQEMTPSLKESYESLKTQVRTPIWTFIGLALFVALIANVFIQDKRDLDRNARLILTPQRGDIFEVKTKDKQYTLFKVDNVKDDSVFIQINNYQTDQLSGIPDLMKKDYSEDIYVIPKGELKKMFDKRQIVDIDRY
jgi:hypothetical protein